MKRRSQPRLAPDPATFGGRLTICRRAKKLTQTDVGNALGVKPQSVSAWEKNEAEPSLHKLKLLADLLDIEVAKLIEAPPQSMKEIADSIEAAAKRYERAVAELNDAQQHLAQTALLYARKD